ncbi:dihydrofolate reductase family protein [Actinomadura barringtoniae]|uniref:Dihydrofolate reductase family protein n=1 Tax=Actinomadura barringtoniae TaxID=1427535 RepID=A0A939T784_9ACTN|nr:dihydrofolate reductase family protein [Actinomadura barringtoniae]MBO2452828.1 dihydrofolate reductase family protein [Actinomadura barringtoniae]
MRIKTHLGVSVDGFISSADGRPALLSVPTFDSGVSHGHPEFIADCGAVVMGRNTFEPAVGASHWPWPDLQVFVLTSRPLPAGTPSHVVSAAKPAELLDLMRKADFEGDVHLVGGQQTVAAFRGIGALDVLGVVTLPILLGGGTCLTTAASDPQHLRLESTRTFPDGAVEHIYSVAAPIG